MKKRTLAMECLICGSVSVKTIGKRSHFCNLDGYSKYVDSLDGFDREIVLCEACGFAFINPMYDRADIARLYGPLYDAFVDDIRGKESSAELIQVWLEQLVSLGISEWRENFERRYSRRPRMLDIGCGYGRVMNLFDRLGFEVSGIEINKAGVDHVRSSYGYLVEEVDLFDYSTPDRYDLIGLWHVIEHVPDPSVAMEKVLSLLSPAGLLVIETPYAEDNGQYEQRYRDIYHTLFFNHLSLFLLGLRHGLSVHRSQRISFFLLGDYHNYIQVVYSRSGCMEIAASHVQSLGALFNGLEREHSDAISKRFVEFEEYRRAVESSLSWRLTRPLNRLRNALFKGDRS
jgi:SAM-dependent methyltransferase